MDKCRHFKQYQTKYTLTDFMDWRDVYLTEIAPGDFSALCIKLQVRYKNH